MDERTIFVDEFHDAASKDGDWLIIGKFTESAEWGFFQNFVTNTTYLLFISYFPYRTPNLSKYVFLD
jgi:hypothetical protein